jgi:UDP-glucose 4,6-dehydratase
LTAETRDVKAQEYRPRSILVTGGAGFIGSHVTNLLLSHYASDPTIRVVVLDRLDYCARPRNWDPILTALPQFAFRRGDICDQAGMRALMEEFAIDTIMAFAAQTLVCTSWSNSHQFVIDNVLGTNNLLQAARDWGRIRRIIHVSTDEVYGEVEFTQKEGCREDAAHRPTNPYAATKSGAEQIAQSFARSYGLPIIITRGNNVYGPGQFTDKMIPKFAVLLACKQKLTIHGKGTARRSFVHVTDVAQAFLTLLKWGVIGEIYNIGSDNEYSVMEIAEQLMRITYGKLAPELIEFTSDRTFNDRRYHICSRKVKSLGWRERVEFAVGLRETAKWYERRVDEYIPSLITTSAQSYRAVPRLSAPTTPANVSSQSNQSTSSSPTMEGAAAAAATGGGEGGAPAAVIEAADVVAK